MKATTLVLFFVCIPLLIQAQELELLDIHCSISPIQTSTSHEYIQQCSIKLRYPIIAGQRNQFLVGPTYDIMWIGKTINDHQALHGLSMQVAWQRKIRSNLSFSWLFTPGIYSDFKDISEEDFRFSTAFRMKHTLSEKTSIGFGIGYARQFFGNVLMPFLEVDWKINDRWSMSGLFPIRPKIEYLATKRLTLGTQIQVDNSSSRLSSQYNESQIVQFKQWNAQLYADWKLYKNLYFSLIAGYVFRRKVQVFTKDTKVPWTLFTFPIGGERTAIHTIADNGYLLQAGLSIKLKR
ncbi:DUF6268 family outer membrane beta-barrel protein [Cytophagaceae bacterium DM2B3-1]|uniref:DUF6268 family outer membrane beta-barrel protein n=1 Tax=Xanthocytophaga flava TaxID=3048013 RepID=A0ABT7CP51_9BACT|nr:DUF6268 family outer membrane beta-barrel protein [Xanthocytophaga flavus]MDJ1495529.1 DUF6268 family outer membrane beta-barrel protein [Xanthocytophaga flavus]